MKDWWKDKLRENGLLLGTFAGIVVGIFSGLTLKYIGASSHVLAIVNYPGELFIRALQLLILPAIAFSLVSGCASLNIKENGKLAIRTFTYFLASSFYNAIMGIILVSIITPGIMINQDNNNVIRDSTGLTDNLTLQPGLIENLLDVGRNIVPDNAITATFRQVKTVYETRITDEGVEIIKRLKTVDGTNFIGLVSICLFLGSIMSTLGDKVKILVEIVNASAILTSKSMGIIIWLTPIGVGCIICGKVFEINDLIGTMALLGWLILTVTIGLLIDQFIIMQSLYFIFLRKNPFKHYLNVFPAAVMAFVTSSSAATLPLTLRCMDEKVKADPRISHFIVPLGVTANKNGTALYLAVTSVFLAQLNGISLNFSNYTGICITATTVSIAAGGPSGSLFVLQALGIPVADIALLFTIDWIMDRMRTMNNVLGDCYSVPIIQHLSSKEMQQ